MFSTCNFVLCITSDIQLQKIGAWGSYSVESYIVWMKWEGKQFIAIAIKVPHNFRPLINSYLRFLALYKEII